MDPLTLKSLNQAKNTKVPNQNFKETGQGVHELWPDIQTNRHPDKRLQLYIFIYTYRLITIQDKQKTVCSQLIAIAFIKTYF